MTQSENHHPAAAPTAAPQEAPSRSLRIAVVQGGRIVEERLLRRRRSVTIGQSSKNTFVVPGSTVLPRSFTLLDPDGDGYRLHFTAGMEGRLAADGSSPPLTLAELRLGAPRRGELFHLPIGDHARGKIVLGDVTVLFHFVTPPPLQARPRLPPSVRGSIARDLDWAMITIVATSITVHAGLALHLRGLDGPRQPDIEVIPDRFVRMMVPRRIEAPPPAVKAPPEARPTVDQVVRHDGPKPSGRRLAPRDPEAEARAEAARRARLAEQVRGHGLLHVLGVRGDDGELRDLLRRGSPGVDGDRVFADVGGVGLAGPATAGLRPPRGSGSGATRGIDGLRARGPAEVESGERGGEQAAVLRGALKESAPTDLDGILDPEVVAAAIRQRKSAVIACYERALKRTPSLRGRLTLRFRVGTVGRVVTAEVEDSTLNDDEVTHCVIRTVKGWRFPAPANGEVAFSYPLIFQPAQ